MFSMFKAPTVKYTAQLDPICLLCGIPMEQDKVHICGVMDWRHCKTCGAKWNPGMYSEDPETCAMCPKRAAEAEKLSEELAAKIIDARLEEKRK